MTARPNVMTRTARRTVLRRAHLAAGILAVLLVVSFWTSTVVVELAGTRADVVWVKGAVPWALLALVPALAVAGATGFRLSGRSRSPLVAKKKRRMPVVAGLGVLVLIPCALLLSGLAARGSFGPAFVLLQSAELVAGAINIVLLGRSLRDGLRLSGRLPAPARAAVSAVSHAMH